MPANSYLYLPLATINARLEAYLAAEAAILGGAQSYSVNGVSITRAGLSQVQQSIAWLSAAQRRASGDRNIVVRPITAPGGY